MSNERNISDFLEECNASILARQIEAALAGAAMAQINHATGSQKAKVTLEFSFQQMGDNSQVIISHKLSTKYPKSNGTKSEDTATETAFFVGKYGHLTIAPPKEEESGQFNLNQENVDRETGEIKTLNVHQLTN